MVEGLKGKIVVFLILEINDVVFDMVIWKLLDKWIE